MLPSRDNLEGLISQCLSRYDDLSQKAYADRRTQASILGITRQGLHGLIKHPGRCDAITFLRCYHACRVFQEKLDSGELPIAHKNKKHAQPDIRDMFGVEAID